MARKTFLGVSVLVKNINETTQLFMYRFFIIVTDDNLSLSLTRGGLCVKTVIQQKSVVYSIFHIFESKFGQVIARRR